jgi:tellurite methyltransferase
VNNEAMICYKQIEINSQVNHNFFLEKHSTKEGTWGLLKLNSGEIDFLFLDGDETEMSRHRINHKHSEMHIPPASWHKLSR